MATVLRQGEVFGSAPGRSPQPIAFSFDDLRGQASEYLDMVRGEAAKIVQDANRQAEQIRRQAEVAGRKAAEDAVDRMLEEKLARRMETLVPALEQSARHLEDAKGELLRQWEKSTLHVATSIAKRIIRRELSQQPQIALDIIADTLRLATGFGQIKLHINPADYEHLGGQIERLAATVCHVAPTDVVADPEVSPGGCRVATTYGQIDQQIESQLARIEEELR
jgi:flagellar assembly protein FliH